MGEIAWKKLKEYNFETMKHDYIMETINNQLYPGHSALTYKLSTSHLKCIAVYGWDHFVNNYLSLVDGLGITQSLSNLNQNYQNVTSVLPTPDENDFPMNLDPQSLTYYEDTSYGAASTQILDGFVEQDVPPGGCFLVQYSMTGSVLDANFATGLPSLLFVYQSELWSISYGGTGSYWFLSPYSEPPQFNYLTFGPVPSGTFSKYWDIQTINGYGNDVYFTATYWDETENMYDGLFQVDMTTFFVSYVSNADGIYNLFIV